MGVLLVAHVLAPGDDLTRVVCLLHRDVGHEPRRGGAMPVVLIRLEEDTVAGTDHLDRTAPALAEADTLGDPDRLPVRVRMPGGARAWHEVHARCAEPRLFGRGCDRVDVHRPGEPVARPRARVKAVSRDLHRSLLSRSVSVADPGIRAA